MSDKQCTEDRFPLCMELSCFQLRVWVRCMSWLWGVVGWGCNCPYGLIAAALPTKDTLKPTVVKPLENTLVVLFLRASAGWGRVGGRPGKRSRVPLSRKFHYPIDADLPSQLGLVLVCFHSSFTLFSSSCRDQLGLSGGRSNHCRRTKTSDFPI